MKLDTNGFKTSIPTIGNNMLDDFSILSSTDLPRTRYFDEFSKKLYRCRDLISFLRASTEVGAKKPMDEETLDFDQC
uniref:Uncharacterized protein n=1 Tax=Brassica campestris TaxID=3711 RepID=M4EEC9_BRACM